MTDMTSNHVPENPTDAELKSSLQQADLEPMARQVQGRLGKNPDFAGDEEE